MRHDELDDLLNLLARARRVLECRLGDAKDVMHDDVAQLCVAIDDALPDTSRVTIKSPARLERTDDVTA